MNKISLEIIIERLKDGSMVLVNKSHLTGSVVGRLELDFKNTNKIIQEYESEITTGVKRKEDSDVDPQHMIDLFKRQLTTTFGQALSQFEVSCANCGSTLYFVVLNDTIATLIEPRFYYDLKESKTEKFAYKLQVTDELPDCKAKELVKQKKLTSIIDIQSGVLYFRNHFSNGDREDNLYSIPDEGYHSINDLQGRNELMQYLATQNVGYGQMGNMSVTVYSNGNDEIIIGDDIAYFDERFLSDKEFAEYVQENPTYWTEERIIEHKQDQADALAFEKLLKDGNFKNLGDISLSVWRWQCADKSVLKKHKYSLKLDGYKDQVIAKVQAGKWQIDHFYDFAENGSFLYSRLKLIQ
jgi:hypothetical protein